VDIGAKEEVELGLKAHATRGKVWNWYEMRSSSKSDPALVRWKARSNKIEYTNEPTYIRGRRGV
jgi:hypothetical protein